MFFIIINLELYHYFHQYQPKVLPRLCFKNVYKDDQDPKVSKSSNPKSQYCKF